MRTPWPPTPVLWLVVVAGLAGGVVALVLDAPTAAIALPVAAALATAAVAVDRRVDGRGRDTARDERRLASDEARVVREVVQRRPLLLRAAVAVGALLGLGAAGWLWRAGPRRDPDTGWADGVRLVDDDGRSLRPADLPAGGIVTVWPEGHRDQELAAVVVLRLGSGDAAPPDGTTTPAPDPGTILAYSRICTHAGCPVALFRSEDSTLYCPCHQATFDARRDARPVFGPASRPLPSLPVGTDADGFLVARGDLSAPPGPRPGGRR